MHGILRSALLVALAAAGTSAQSSLPGPQLRLAQGVVLGATSRGVESFKGIPYAAPPVGGRRWRPPQAPAGWKGIRSATRPGPACVQPVPELSTGPQSEDCLFLNIWKTAGPRGRPLPVMLWIHGGGFVEGWSTSPVYDGANLARKGVVVVSFNYRLGRLGFFAHPALTAEAAGAPTGNFALMDQIAALRWVRANARAFGGDPDNVTIFGESSGALSVNTLMASPAAHGLFAKAISQSGRGRDSNFPVRGAGNVVPIRGLLGRTAEDIGVGFARTLGVEGTGPDALSALRALPARRFTAALGSDVSSGAYIDGALLLEPVAAAFAAGREAQVPYMIGANACERCSVPEIGRDPDARLSLAGRLRTRVLETYGGSPAEVAVDFAGDMDHVEPARHLARLHAGNGLPTFVYNFAHLSALLRLSYRAPPHGEELPFVFGTLILRTGGLVPSDARQVSHLPEDRKVADAMTTYWTNFAKTGDPGSFRSIRWPGFRRSDETVLVLKAGGPRRVPFFRRAHLDVVEQVAAVAGR